MNRITNIRYVKKDARKIESTSLSPSISIESFIEYSFIAINLSTIILIIG